MSNKKKIAESAISRLSLYLRILEDMVEEGEPTVSSQTMASQSGTILGAPTAMETILLFGN